MRAFALLLPLALAAMPAAAWSPETALAIAVDAASIAPPDLERQIERHEKAYKAALLDEARQPSAAGQPLDRAIELAAERAIGMINTHQPFEDIVRQLAATAYYVASANNPLIIGSSDSNESSYFGDYLVYVDSARPRFAVVFYGLVPEFEASRRIGDLVAQTFRRGQVLYPMVGREYERVGGPPGRERFDDRSTAFGVSAIAYSQAVTDVAILFRHIWLEAGGIDPRPELPVREGEFEAPVAGAEIAGGSGTAGRFR